MEEKTLILAEKTTEGGSNEGESTKTDSQQWVNVDKECLRNWQCSMNTYEVLGIRGWEKADSEWFVQDVILGSTFFIWTVVVIGLVVSWLMFVMAWYDEKKAEKWKEWLKYSLIGLVVVIFSYTIIKIIQNIAAG